MTDPHVVEEGRLKYDRFDTAAMLTAAVTHVNNMIPAPDVVVLTGDLVDSGNGAQYEVLLDIVSQLDMPYYPISGNHDDTANLLTAFFHIPEIPRPDAETVDYVVDSHPVRLVAIDTSIPGEHGGRLSDEQLDWLDRTLAERPDTPTLMLMHHPPFLTGIDWMDQAGLESPEKLEAVVSRHPQIGAVLCGHLHRPIQASFGGTIAMTSSSTAMQVALGLEGHDQHTIVDEPPSVGVHVWPDGGSLVSHSSVIAPEQNSFVPEWAPKPTS